MNIVYRALASMLALTTCSTVAVTRTASATGPWCNQITIIGDSLTAYGNGALHTQFPKAIINARGGRTTADGWEPAEGVKESNVSDCWVIALGTNDVYQNLSVSAMQAAISHMISVIGPTDHVWWILPQFGTASGLNPATFDSLVPAYVAPIDIHTPAADFLADGIHLTALGYQHRATAIAAALAA